MLVDKYEFQGDKFVPIMRVPLKNTLLEKVCSGLGVDLNSVAIVELGGIAPKELRKEGKNGKAKLEFLMGELEVAAQSVFDNGITLGNTHYRLLQATSGAKQSASMLLSSDERLVNYFKALMTHPSKSYEQLMMGYQLALTPNKALVTAKLKVLIVDDEFDSYQIHGGSISQCVGANPDGSPKWEVISTWEDETIKHFDTRQSVGGVGDCHVKISRNMANYLSTKVVGFNATTGQPMTFLDSANQGCQFRLMVHDVPAMAKGTFVVSDNVPEGYHMVIPKSSFKLGYPNLPTTDGTYRITLGATMPAVDGKAAFGSQFARSMSKSVLESRKPVIAEQMERLNLAGSSIQEAAKFFNAEANSKVIWFEEDENGEEVEQFRDDWFYKAMASIATSERLNWALKDPTIIQRILSSLAKRKMKLALGMGFEGRVRTALPDDTLPLHVISAVDAPKLRWHNGQWFNGNKPLPHNAVGMVECQGVQHIGLLVVRGKAPIMNHAEQALAVLVHRNDGGIGYGSEFMSHQSASVCTMDFDGDRNSSLVWKDEDGYLEAINHFVELQRMCPITPVTKEKSKVNQSWGTLTKLVYESAFEMGCSGVTSMYCQATEAPTLEGFKNWMGSIAVLTGATQLYLDCQKYAPTNPNELKTIINDAMQYYQAWQTDQKSKELQSVPYIHRGLKTSKPAFISYAEMEKGITKKPVQDVGTIAACINYTNSLHEVPALLAGMAPMARLKGIWGEYTPADVQVAKELRESLRNLKGLSEEGDCKKIGAIFDYARSTTKDWTDAQFSAFWDLWYKHESLVVKNRKGDEYMPIGGTPWAIFCDRILAATPSLETRTERVLFKKLQANSIIEFLKERGASEETVTIGEVVQFAEKNGAIQMRTVHSIDGRLIGYVPLTIEQGTYRVVASLVNDAKGSPYKSCFQIKIVGKL